MLLMVVQKSGKTLKISSKDLAKCGPSENQRISRCSKKQFKAFLYFRKDVFKNFVRVFTVKAFLRLSQTLNFL